MVRVVALGIVVLMAMAGIMPAAPQAAAEPTEDDLYDAGAMVMKIARLEAKGLFDVLYGYMHPDSQAVVPEEVVVAWYEREFSDKVVGEPEITDVDFADWKWDVTGKIYRDAAAVSFVQAVVVDGEADEVEGVLHLVEDDGDWKWFFGDSEEWVEEQIALFTVGEDGIGPSPFKNRLDADVDRFWARAFAAADQEYLPPEGVMGFDGPITTGCGMVAPPVPEAFYCGIDETIYYVADFRDAVEGEMGDFAWVTVIAHEWGHHIQDRLGIRGSFRPDVSGRMSYKETELQADCLAGAYTRDAKARGWLGPEDIGEAVDLTSLAGDPPDAPQDDLLAHGTGEERVQAFREGYNGGIDDCGIDLSALSE